MAKRAGNVLAEVRVHLYVWSVVRRITASEIERKERPQRPEPQSSFSGRLFYVIHQTQELKTGALKCQSILHFHRFC